MQSGRRPPGSLPAGLHKSARPGKADLTVRRIRRPGDAGDNAPAAAHGVLHTHDVPG